MKEIFSPRCKGAQPYAAAALGAFAAAMLLVLPGIGSADEPPAPPAHYRVAGDMIPMPLTARAGDPAEGRKIVEDRKLGNCLSCHAFPLAAADQGNVGPDLHGVGSRYKPAQLRLRVVNMKVLDPQTIMPAYYRVDGLRDVGRAFAGKPILDAQQVEDLVAYLATLTKERSR